jgi:hypothetical protein
MFNLPMRFGEPGNWQFGMSNGNSAKGKWLWIGLKVAWLRTHFCPGRLYNQWHTPVPYSQLPEYGEQTPICKVCYRDVHYL